MNEFDDVSTERLTAIADGTIPADPGARRYARAVLWQRGIGTDPYATSATPAVSLPRVGDIPDPLDAAATPITPEPMAGGAPEFDSGIPLKTGVGFGRLPGRTQTIEGVEVPVYENAAGKQYYRLGDINAAQAAAREAERVRLQEESNARQEQQFGYMSDSPTPEQLANRVQSRAGARRQAATGAATRQRVERLADRLGVPYNVAYDAYEKALSEASPADSDMVGAGGGVSVGVPKPGLGHAADAVVGPDGLLTPRGIGHVMDAATRDLMANSGGVDRRAKQKAEARDIITRRAQLRTNPMEYLGRDDLDDWQRMVAARALVGSSGFTPVEMQAKQNELLQQLGERFLQGGGGRPLDPAQAAAIAAQTQRQQSELPIEEQVSLHVKDDAVHSSELQHADEYVGRMYSSDYGPLGTSSDYTLAEQQDTINYLVETYGYTPAKAQRIVDEIVRRRQSQSWGRISTRGAPAVSNPTGGAI